MVAATAYTVCVMSNSICLPIIKKYAPVSPTSTPHTFHRLNFTPKKSTPTNSAQSGVSPFIAPAKELDMPVCAAVKRNAGRALPKKPLITKNLKSPGRICMFFQRSKGSRAMPANAIRIAAT